jgi:hypothetical protein
MHISNSRPRALMAVTIVPIYPAGKLDLPRTPDPARHRIHAAEQTQSKAGRPLPGHPRMQDIPALPEGGLAGNEAPAGRTRPAARTQRVP